MNFNDLPFHATIEELRAMSNECLFDASDLPESTGLKHFKTELLVGDTVQLRNGMEYRITTHDPQSSYPWAGKCTAHGPGYIRLMWRADGKYHLKEGDHHLDIVKIVYRPRPKKEPTVYDLRSYENFLTSLTTGQRQALDAYYVRKDKSENNRWASQVREDAKAEDVYGNSTKSPHNSLGEEGAVPVDASWKEPHEMSPLQDILQEKERVFSEAGINTEPEAKRMEALFSKKIVDATLGDLMEVLRNYEHPDDV